MILNAVAKIVTWYLYLRLIEYAFENIPTPTVFATLASDLTTNVTSSSSSATCAPTGYEPCCPNCDDNAVVTNVKGILRRTTFGQVVLVLAMVRLHIRLTSMIVKDIRRPGSVSLFGNLPDLGISDSWTAKFFRRGYVYFPEYDGLRDL